MSCSQPLDGQDVGHVGDHGLQPACGEGGHGNMVFLVGAGGQRIHAGRVGQRLVFAGQGGGGHVGDHQAAVEAGIGRQEWRQARDTGVDHHGHAPLGDGADLGDRAGHRVAGQGHGLGVEVAAADEVVTDDQRVVRHGVGFAQQHQRRVAKLVQAGPHHLRLAAQAVRVLHAVVAAARGVHRQRDGSGLRPSATVSCAPAGPGRHWRRRCLVPAPREPAWRCAPPAAIQ